LEFHEQWINWALETSDEEMIAKIGQRCYQNSEWVKKLPAYSGTNHRLFTKSPSGFSLSTHRKRVYGGLE